MNSLSVDSALEDFFYHHPQEGDASKVARYINSWVEAGDLRQHYPEQSDIANFETSAELEKFLDWIYALEIRNCIKRATL